VNQPLLQMDLRLVGLAVLLLGVAFAVIWRVGRRLRGELGPLSGPAGTGSPARSQVPPEVARVLQQRGLATPAQLVNMSEAERQLLFSSVSSVIGAVEESESGPRLSGVRAVIHSRDLEALYCPACGYRIERFTSTPPITGQCETCRARIVVRRDGARLLLTVVPGDEVDGRRTDLRLEP